MYNAITRSVLLYIQTESSGVKLRIGSFLRGFQPMTSILCQGNPFLPAPSMLMSISVQTALVNNCFYNILEAGNCQAILYVSLIRYKPIVDFNILSLSNIQIRSIVQFHLITLHFINIFQVYKIAFMNPAKVFS